MCSGITACIVKKSAWDKITANSQKLIRKITKELLEKEDIRQKRINDKCLRILTKSGVSIIQAETQKKWMQNLLDASKQTREEFVGKSYSRELLDKTTFLLRKYRKKHPESKIMKINYMAAGNSE